MTQQDCGLMMHFSRWSQAVLLAATVVANSSCLPVVDLGYEKHRAIAYNESSGLYNFTNIRYAQPPVGNLRFAAPVAPEGREEEVQDGSGWRQCPNAYPIWSLIAGKYAAAFATGNTDSFNYGAAAAEVDEFVKEAGIPAVYAQPNPAVTEDCLFLDVVVPKKVFESEEPKAPVLVWILGGAFSAGQKNYHNSGNPSGLIKVSQEDGSDGIIYVTLNYRLGALGFLAGPTFQAEGGVSNAGLLDQHLALQWVQDNIHLFGGDRDRVTVMGASAGGSSIMHALTTRAGVNTPRFQRAIALYSGYVPMTSNFQQENATETFYKHLNVSSLAEAREASSEAVILANAEVIGRSAYSHFPFGPVVDGILIPQHPSISFLNGGFNKDVQIMTGHSVNEAVTFAPPYVETDEEFGQFLRELYPTIRDPVVDYVTEELYPGQGANRTIHFVSDNGMKCNTDYLRRAYDRQTYGYEFRIPPSFHGGDFPYYFYNGPDPEDGAAGLPSVARMLQRYIINFVKNGDPNGEGLDQFPPAGEGSLMLAITGDGNTVERDATDSEQCRWLQKILYG